MDVVLVTFNSEEIVVGTLLLARIEEQESIMVIGEEADLAAVVIGGPVKRASLKPYACAYPVSCAITIGCTVGGVDFWVPFLRGCGAWEFRGEECALTAIEDWVIVLDGGWIQDLALIVVALQFAATMEDNEGNSSNNEGCKETQEDCLHSFVECALSLWLGTHVVAECCKPERCEEEG